MAANRPNAPSASTWPGAPPVVVGRQEEQALLGEALASALAGRGRLVLLGGEAGIGKTTLARDVAGQAEEHGAHVLAGHCYDLTNTPPYGPWLDLAAGYRPDSALPPLPAAFAGGRLDRVTDQAALFADVCRFLGDLAAIRPAVVVLEDLHWADPASIELLRHVGPHLGPWPVCLLATYRVDEPTRRHPFYQQLPALIREGPWLRLHPRRLDTTAFRELVAARYRLSAEDEARLVTYLERHAEGNPFFAVELLRALEEDGLLRRGTDRSTLGELARVIVPSLVRQVIDGRLARLGEETRQPLAIAAVIGQQVPLALWAEVANLDEEALLGVVDQAVEAHLLEAEPDGTRVRFVHALTREALYDGILPPRRRLYHRHVAQALESDPGVDLDAVATHFQQAGDPRAWEWLERAGNRAQRAYAWHTAADRLRSAADLLDGVEGQGRKQRELLYRFAHCLRFSDPASGILALDDIDRLSVRDGDTLMLAEVQYIRGFLLCYADRFRQGLTELTNALEVLEAIAPDTAQAPDAIRTWYANVITASVGDDLAGEALIVERLRSAGFDSRRCIHPWFSASGGQPEPAAIEGERFVAAFAGVEGTGGFHVTGGFAYHGLGLAYAALGRPNEARQAWMKSRANLRAVDHFAVIAFTLLGELRDVALTYGAADPAARRQLAADAEEVLGRAGGALQSGVSPRLAWLSCLVVDGQWEEADQILRDLPRPRNCYLRREATAATALLARYRGDPDAARAEIRSLLPDGPATEPGDIIHQEGLFLLRLAADLCLDTGDLPTSRAWLGAHDRWLAWSRSVLGRAEGAVAWARWHHAAGEAAAARARAAEALDLATSPDQPLVRLAAHRLLGEIETATTAYAPAESHLKTALALADACAAPYERALTLLALAGMRLATGATGDAATLLGEVRSICTPLNARPALARAAALAGRAAKQPPAAAHPAGLTQREVDVLRLLAQHRTDKEIAAALFIGPRTVQTHVANILGKLGVENRRAAAIKAARLGLV